MSVPINELPPVQREILIIMRREKLTPHRLLVSLKHAAVDCPDLMPHLHALADLEFLQVETRGEEELWSLTDKGKVAAELLWFDRQYGDVSKLFSAIR